MSTQSKHKNAAHQSAVSDILQSRRKALEWLTKLSISSGIDWDSAIINDNPTNYSQHPQRPAHAYTLLYAKNVANKSYWPKEKDLYSDTLKTPAGDKYVMTIPKAGEYTIQADSADAKSQPLSLDDFDVITETASIEMLNHKWKSRQITVHIETDSPYYEHDMVTRDVDLWMPPKLIDLAFEQLDQLAASLDFLAEPSDELPVWGFEEVDGDG